MSINFTGVLPFGSTAARQQGPVPCIYCTDIWQFFADQPATWSLTGVGSIDSSGVYTAPVSGGGSFTVTATSVADGTTTSLTLPVMQQVARTVDVDPTTYTPPPGFQYAGDAGILIQSPGDAPSYTHRTISGPVGVYAGHFTLRGNILPQTANALIADAGLLATLYPGISFYGPPTITVTNSGRVVGTPTIPLTTSPSALVLTAYFLFNAIANVGSGSTTRTTYFGVTPPLPYLERRLIVPV